MLNKYYFYQSLLRHALRELMICREMEHAGK